ncbi:unnamed protein product [Spirodela intermedia]|nr:unnamed protein product [Spirodela intermedia]
MYLDWLEKWESLPLGEKTTTPTSASHSTASSRAFFSRPLRRLEKLTIRLAPSSIR